MPRSPTYALVWVPESASYELWTQGRREFFFRASDETTWLAWLETHVAFSFCGQRGALNARKEHRQRGQGYWYGYRGLEKRTVKRYLGPTARVTLARLEEVAGKFGQTQAFTDTHLRAAEDGTEILDPASGFAHSKYVSRSLSLKFCPPRLRERLVERSRLLQLLEAGQTYRLTLLSAPAGSGKTTLVGQWLASFQREAPAVAWVSLDESDNDVVRFWQAVVSAYQEIAGERTHIVLEELAELGRVPSLLEASVLELVLTDFLDKLASLPGYNLVMLEDYHLITLSQVHTSFSFWLEHLPSNLRVIMLTRHDPPLPLAQWRVRGFLYEIRDKALRFTMSETALFFQQNSVHAVSPADSERLLERTEGWIAGLQLAVLVLNTQGLAETMSSILQGSHHYIAEYLVQEVLNHLPEKIQLFLEQTSLLERLQGRLCETVTGQSEGQQVLAWLEQANLFMVPLDENRQWYRYHHLFREVLFQRLAQKSPEYVVELHRRACRWFLSERMPSEAVAHASAARDFVLLADVIEQSQSSMLSRGENATLLAWIHLLPESILLERLSIFFLACLEYMAAHRANLAAELLNAYARWYHLPEVGTDDIDGLERACCAHVSQLFPRQRDDPRWSGAIYGFLGFYATLALVMKRDVALYQRIRQRSEQYASPVTLRRQESWLAALLLGDIQGAIADLMKNLAESTTRPENTFLFAHIYPTLTSLLTTTGQLQQVEFIARRMLQKQDTLDARLNHGSALIDLGSIAYERDELEQAEASIRAGLSLCHYPGSKAARYRGLLLLTKIKRAWGDRTAAWAFLREFETELSESDLEAHALQNWRGLLAWGALDLGDISYARLWLQDNSMASDLATHLNPLSANIYLTRAFFLLRFERTVEAEALLATLSTWARQLELHGMLVSLLAFQSLLAQAKDEETQAETFLKEALVLAEVPGYVRVFLDLGEEMQVLLRRLCRQSYAGDQRSLSSYLARLLALARNDGRRGYLVEPAFSQALIEPLSQREQEVLREINEGYSNQEIARHLVISPSTVKSHINSIYRKLQTTSRAQTIARVRTLNLFPD